MQDLPPADQYDPDNPPESVVVLSLGTDTTDLVVTNGYRVWQRSVPIGGSHFTKALTKELRLTFAKAEHLKKNAAQAEDPKAVFQAMRPVFNDLLTQLQRSISYFPSIDRSAKIGRVMALGNAMKLPGLQKYLSQNLGYPVTEVEAYRGLRERRSSMRRPSKRTCSALPFAMASCCKASGNGKLSTNLLPREILTDRLIREKKPWAVSIVAALLLGCALNFVGQWCAWNSVADAKFKAPMDYASNVERDVSSQKSAFDTAKTEFTQINQIGEGLVGNVDGRRLWLELVLAVDQCLPTDPSGRPEDIADRKEIHVEEARLRMVSRSVGVVRRWHFGNDQTTRRPARRACRCRDAPPVKPRPPIRRGSRSRSSRRGSARCARRSSSRPRRSARRSWRARWRRCPSGSGGSRSGPQRRRLGDSAPLPSLPQQGSQHAGRVGRGLGL